MKDRAELNRYWEALGRDQVLARGENQRLIKVHEVEESDDFHEKLLILKTQNETEASVCLCV